MLTSPRSSCSPRALVLAPLLLAVACSREEPKSLAAQIEGRWRLERLQRQPLAATQIELWEIEFQKNGQWKYSGRLGGAFGGMSVSGAGTWYLRDHTLVYSAGDAHGAAVLKLAEPELTFLPDPVLTTANRQSAVSVYRRVPPHFY